LRFWVFQLNLFRSIMSYRKYSDMKTLLIVFIISLIVFINSESKAAPVLYLNFVSHNEDADQFNNFPAYKNKRDMIVQFVNMLVAKGMPHNFQSDWTFLKAVARFDTGSVVANTNGKNIIKWMVEDKGIECDPHSHESTLYNYADVAYLHSVLGITPTKVVGGFLYDTVVNGNNWENLEAGIYGRYYTTYFWKPDILWGGGTQQHQNDPNIYGVFKPKSMAQYYVHDSTKHLTLIGNGCANKIFEATNIDSSLLILRSILNAMANHTVPDTGFYTASIFVSNVTLSNNIINKVSSFIDSIAPYVAQNKIRLCKISETYSIWNTQYNKKPFWFFCSSTPMAISSSENEIVKNFYLYQNYPNPFNPTTKINFELAKSDFISLKVYGVTGNEIENLIEKQMPAGFHSVEFNAAKYSSGVYFYRIINSKNETVTRKMILMK